MRAYLWRMFAGSLGLTLVTELAVAFLYFSLELLRERHGRAPVRPGRRREALGPVQGGGRHGARIVLLVVLVNVLTNPPAVLVCWLGRLWMPPQLQLFLELGAEAAVVAVEGGIYAKFGRKPGWEIRRPILLAVAANGASWLLGLSLR